MALGDACTLLVGFFLVLFVMSMVRVDDVVELAKLFFDVGRLDFGLVKVSA